MNGFTAPELTMGVFHGVEVTNPFSRHKEMVTALLRKIFGEQGKKSKLVIANQS